MHALFHFCAFIVTTRRVTREFQVERNVSALHLVYARLNDSNCLAAQFVSCRGRGGEIVGEIEFIIKAGATHPREQSIEEPLLISPLLFFLPGATERPT